MAFPNKNNGKNNHLGPKVFQGTEGLDDFIKDLEKYFFATAKLKCKQDVVHNRLDLVVELHFNFSVSDCLRHFNNGDWSGYSIPEESKSDMCTTMTNVLKNLNEKSTYPTDIMETSLHFRDTSIIISRLYPNSIPEHIGKIISMINQHFIYFTKGLTQMPYEIFVPIFEDTSLLSKQPRISNKCGYYDYWGLYFDKGQEHEALIYSLNKKKFYEENIFLFE